MGRMEGVINTVKYNKVQENTRKYKKHLQIYKKYDTMCNERSRD